MNHPYWTVLGERLPSEVVKDPGQPRCSIGLAHFVAVAFYNG